MLSPQYPHCPCYQLNRLDKELGRIDFSISVSATAALAQTTPLPPKGRSGFGYRRAGPIPDRAVNIPGLSLHCFSPRPTLLACLNISPPRFSDIPCRRTRPRTRAKKMPSHEPQPAAAQPLGGRQPPPRRPPRPRPRPRGPRANAGHPWPARHRPPRRAPSCEPGERRSEGRGVGRGPGGGGGGRVRGGGVDRLGLGACVTCPHEVLLFFA